MATGIADYSFELLPLVASSADVVAVCPRPRRFRPVRTPAGVPVVTPDRFAKEDGADANVYHLGNNPYHEFVYRAAMAEPGIAVFHDFVMHHLLAAVTIEQHRDAAQYRRIPGAGYRARGTRLARLRGRRRAARVGKVRLPLS